jgi:hypothetical protein
MRISRVFQPGKFFCSFAVLIGIASDGFCQDGIKVYAARTEVLNLDNVQANFPRDEQGVEKYLEQERKKETFKVPPDAIVLTTQAYVIHAVKEAPANAKFRKLFQLNKANARWRKISELTDEPIGLSPERILIVVEEKTNLVWLFNLWPGQAKMYLGTDCGMNFFQGLWGTKVSLVESSAFWEELWKAARLDEPDAASPAMTQTTLERKIRPAVKMENSSSQQVVSYLKTITDSDHLILITPEDLPERSVTYSAKAISELNLLKALGEKLGLEMQISEGAVVFVHASPKAKKSPASH